MIIEYHTGKKLSNIKTLRSLHAVDKTKGRCSRASAFTLASFGGQAKASRSQKIKRRTCLPSLPRGRRQAGFPAVLSGRRADTRPRLALRATPQLMPISRPSESKLPTFTRLPSESTNYPLPSLSPNLKISFPRDAEPYSLDPEFYLRAISKKIEILHKKRTRNHLILCRALPQSLDDGIPAAPTSKDTGYKARYPARRSRNRACISRIKTV